MLHLKGEKAVRVTPVPLSAASLNSGDVFVLDQAHVACGEGRVWGGRGVVEAAVVAPFPRGQ